MVKGARERTIEVHAWNDSSIAPSSTNRNHRNRSRQYITGDPALPLGEEAKPCPLSPRRFLGFIVHLEPIDGRSADVRQSADFAGGDKSLEMLAPLVLAGVEEADYRSADRIGPRGPRRLMDVARTACQGQFGVCLFSS